MTQTIPGTPTVTPPDAQPLERPDPVERAPGAPRGGSHIVGAFSMESFCDVGGLSYTHEDAQGFLDWFASYQLGANFWFQDSAVKIWAYGEEYDNWQDTYGIDADLVSYHSGHGGMDANGVFYAPMGAAWAGNDCTAMSTQMGLGNEYLRYLFWSTCLSLRVLDGHNPIRTWHQANQGLRMIFGFETVSWDNPDYGRNFGRHWNAGESLGSAWLNASWDIAHDQAPSVVACGASQAEAQDRVFNERFFSRTQAGNAWYWWRWYDVARAARDLNTRIPDSIKMARLVPPDLVAAERFGFDGAQLRADARGQVITDGDRRLSADPSGVLTVRLGEPNRANRTPLAATAAQTAAREALREYGLDADGSLVLDRIAQVDEAGAAVTRSESVEGPYRTETLVQFRQVIDGLPVITPGAGAVRVLVDNDGTPTSIISSVRRVDDLNDRPFAAPAVPPAPPNAPEPESSDDPERLLAGAFRAHLRSLALRGDPPVGLGVVPGTTEVGYDIQGDRAVLIAQRAVEVDFGEGIRKRYWIKAPISG